MKTINEESKGTAKKLRKALKKAFPDLPANHFSIRASTYAGGSSVRVHWDDYPSELEVEDVTKLYESATFDGMSDFKSISGYIDPEDGKQYTGADYILLSRTLSDERSEAIRRTIIDVYGEEYYEEHKREKFPRKKIDDMLDKNNKVKGEYSAELVAIKKENGLLKSNPESPDVKILDILTETYNSLNGINKTKVVRIVKKKDFEVVRLARSSRYFMGNLKNNIPVLKYEAPKSHNLTFYQTPFALYVYKNHDDSFHPVYKYGAGTLEQSVRAAKKMVNTYGLDPIVIQVAEKMYINK